MKVNDISWRRENVNVSGEPFGVRQILFSVYFPLRGGGTLGQHWLLKQFSLNHPVEHIQKPKLPKLYVRVETSTSYFIIHNQFVK